MATSIAPDVSRVPGPASWLPGAAFLKFRRDPLAFFTHTQRTYGDIAGFSFGPQQFYLVSHPDSIEDVLVTSARKFKKGVALQRAKRLLGEGLLTSEGKAHLKQRRTIQPLFHRQQVQRFADAMVNHAVRWSDSVPPNAPINITDQMGALTLAIVGETLFSSNVQGDVDDVREALAAAVESFGVSFLPGLEYIEKLPLPVFVRVRKARERLDRVIHRVIAERRREAAARQQSGDLIAMLLAARDPENPDEAGMSDEQIRDEAMTIFLAGHETTANAMAWTWHLLGSHPEVSRRLQSELSSVLGGRVPAVEDVAKLEYARAVIAESMRLYPPAWTMGRRVLEEHTIAGHRIAAGSLVIMSQWVVHRDPRWWPDADRFQPARWLKSEAAAPSATPAASGPRPKYAYFPFGGGTRICIGESFAWTEAILLLATIAQRWDFVPVSQPDPEPRITLRPRNLVMRSVPK
ncbi:MAG TPA: cytochrome P450 [Vicinamibacterales bacterium]|nr:cytochrome P450 [Vicinamibacterales bacterium]